MKTTYEEALEYITSDTCILEAFTDVEICSEDDFFEAMDILDEASEDEVIEFVLRSTLE